MSFSTLPWKYVNEGNVHIVLQILENNYVLRFIKQDNKKLKKASVLESVEFVNLVMIPLIFFDYRYQEEVIEFSLHDINNLVEKLYEFRPKDRLFKSSLYTFAIKAPNLTIINKNADNYCIEIKPKEGFLANSLKKYSKCYYCLKQLMKLKDQKIEKVSNYCPLDLFSGNRNRMKFALESLIGNPQNNFKVLKNGVLICKEHVSFSSLLQEINVFGSSINLFLDSIIGILLGDGKSDINIVETESTTIQSKSELCKIDNNLESYSFMGNLLNLQRLSENFNCSLGKHRENIDYVHSILNELKSNKLDLKNRDHRDLFLTRENFHLALIAAIVKDSSIMISFVNSTNNDFPKLCVGGHKLSYKLGVTDLEPKMASVLQKRRETERRLLDIYAKIAKAQQ